MKKVHRIKVEPLTAEGFAPYGRVIDVPTEPAPFGGDGWGCWFPLGEVKDIDSIAVGYTESLKRDFIIEKMERHETKEEILMPLTDAIIQPMGLPENLDDPNAKPDPETVRAFLLKPGQAIIMNKGAWHSPAYSVEKDTIYVFFAQTSGETYPWLTFKDDVIVEMKL